MGICKLQQMVQIYIHFFFTKCYNIDYVYFVIYISNGHHSLCRQDYKAILLSVNCRQRESWHMGFYSCVKEFEGEIVTTQGKHVRIHKVNIYRLKKMVK